MRPLRVAIDTDPGLDDAIALLFALNDPAFQVELVTSVAGNIGIERTTGNVGRLLAAAGARVPYATGASRPLTRPGIDEEAIHGTDGIGGVALPEPVADPLAHGAVEAMADRLGKNPAGTITTFALGPLTNLALLARDHALLYRRIGRIVVMGGAIRESGNCGPHAEFNFASDPEAARLVLAAGVPVTLVPLDVTRRLRAMPADLDRLEAAHHPSAALAATLIRAYFAQADGRESRPLHDPCVMLLAAAPDLFQIETMRLVVDCKAEPGRLIEDPHGPPVGVAMAIDAPAALARLWRGLGA